MAINVGSAYFDLILKTKKFEKQVADIQRKVGQVHLQATLDKEAFESSLAKVKQTVSKAAVKVKIGINQEQAKQNLGKSIASLSKTAKSINLGIQIINLTAIAKTLSNITQKAYKISYQLVIGNLVLATQTVARFAQTSANVISKSLSSAFKVVKRAADSVFSAISASLSRVASTFRNILPDRLAVAVTLTGLTAIKNTWRSFTSTLGFILRDVLTNTLRFFDDAIRKLIAIPIGFAKSSVSDFTAVASDLEKTVAKVNLTGGATRESFTEELTKEISKVAAGSAATPQSLGQLADILSTAGRTNEEIIKLLKPIGVGSIALNRSASNLAGDIALILDSFNLQADSGGEILNLIAATTTSANLTADTLAQTIKYFRSQQAGIEGLTNTLTVSALAAAGGLQGSRAGTNLARLFSQAIKNAEEVQKTFGVNVQDDQGNLRGEVEILRELTEAYRRIAEERGTAFALSSANDLFQVQGARALTSIAKIGSDNFTKVVTASQRSLQRVGQSGEKVLDELQDASLRNITGAFLTLENKLASLRFTLGDTISPIVEGFVRAAAGVLEPIAQSEKLFEALGKSADRFLEVLSSEEIKASLAQVSEILLDQLIIGFDFLAKMVNDITDKIQQNPDFLVNIANRLVELVKILLRVSGVLIQIGKSLVDFIFWLNDLNGVADTIGVIFRELLNIINAFVMAFTGGLSSSVLSAQGLQNIIVGISNVLQPIAAILGGISGVIVQIVTSLTTGLSSGGFIGLADVLVDKIVSISAAVQRSVPGIISSLSSVVLLIAEAVSGFAGGVFSGAAPGAASLGGSIAASLPSQSDGSLDVGGASRGFGEAIGTVAGRILRSVGAILDGIRASGISLGEVFGTIQRIAGVLFRTVLTVIQSVVMTVVNLAQALLPQIMRTLGDIGRAVATVFTAIAQFVSRGDVQEYLRRIIGLIGAMFLTIAEFISRGDVQKILADVLHMVLHVFRVVVNQLLPTVLNLAVQVMPTVLSALQTALNIMGQLIPFVARIIQYTASLVDEFLPVISSIISQVISILNNNLRNISTLIRSVLGLVFSALGAVLDLVESPAAQKFIDGFTNAIAYVSSQLTSVIHPLSKGLLEGLQVVASLLPPVLTTAANLLKPLISGIGVVISSLGGLLGSFSTGFTNNFDPGSFDIDSSGITRKSTSAISAFTEAAKPIAEQLGSVFAGVANTVGEIAKYSSKIVYKLMEAGSIVSGFLPSVSQLSDFLAGITSRVTGLVAAIAEAAVKVEFITSLGNSLSSVFENLVAGISRIVEVVIQSAQPGIDKLLATIEESSPELLQLLVNLGDWIAKLSTLLVPLGETIGNMLGLAIGEGARLLAVLVKIIEGIAYVFNLMSGETGLITASLNLLVDGANSLFNLTNGIIDGIRNISSVLLDGIYPAAHGIGQLLGGFIQPFILAIAGAFRGIALILEGIGTLIYNIPGAAKKEWEGLLLGIQTTGQIATAIWNSLTTTVSAYLTAIPMVFQSYLDAIPVVIDSYMKAIPLVIQSYGQAFALMWEMLTKGWEDTTNAIYIWFTETMPTQVAGFFSGIGEMLSGLSEQIAQFFFGTDEYLVATTGSIGIIDTTSQGLFVRLGESLTGFFGTLNQGFLVIIEFLQVTFTEAWNSTISAISNTAIALFQSINEWIKNTFDFLLQWFSFLISEPLTKLNEYLLQLFSRINEWIKNTFNFLVEWFNYTIAEPLTRLNEYLLQFFTRVNEWIKNTFNFLVEWFNYTIAEPLTKLNEYLVQFFTRVNEWIKNTFNFLLEWFNFTINDPLKRLSEAVRLFVESVLKWLDETFKWILESLGNIIKYISETVTKAISDFLNWIIESLKSIWDWLVQQFQWLLDTLGKVKDYLIKEIREGALGGIYTAAKNVMGIFDGWGNSLKDALGTLNQIGKAAANAAGGAVSAVTGAVGGNTDKAMAELNKYFSTGKIKKGSNEGIFKQAGLSQVLIDLVKATEGFYSTPYFDRTQYTSGFGTKARSTTERIGVEEANRRLLSELQKARKQTQDLARKYGISLNANQLDALTSFTFNGGIGMTNTLFQSGRRKDINEIARAMLLYNKSGTKTLQGLTNRRKVEQALFLSNPGAVNATTTAIGGAFNNVTAAAGSIANKLGSYLTNTLPGKQHFGASRSGGTRRHAGTDFDINDRSGTFQSIIGGEVIRVGNDPGGYYKYIDVYNKALGVVERIAELNKFYVKKGDTVRAGQVVGGGGTPTGVVHYEIRNKSAYNQNPFGYSTARDPIAFLTGLGLYSFDGKNFRPTGKTISQQVGVGYGGVSDTLIRANEMALEYLKKAGESYTAQDLANLTEQIQKSLMENGYAVGESLVNGLQSLAVSNQDAHHHHTPGEVGMSGTNMVDSLQQGLVSRMEAHNIEPSMIQQKIQEFITPVADNISQGIREAIGDITLSVQFGGKPFVFETVSGMRSGNGNGTVSNDDDHQYVTVRQLKELENYLTSPDYLSDITNSTLETIRRSPSVRDNLLL